MEDFFAVAVEMVDKAQLRSTACPSPPSECEGDSSGLPTALPWQTLVGGGTSSLQPPLSTGRNRH